MKNPFASLFRARDKPGRNEKPTDSISSAATFYFGSSASGKSVTATTAIQMSTVYACVRVIAETIASLPLHVYQNQGEGSVKAPEHPLYRMLQDCEAGKIDMILTKSISRFARNLPDCVRVIRRLQELKIPVLFEKENIDTLDAKSELLLNVLATVAEEESVSISQNMRWSHERRNAAGDPFNKAPYGYRRNHETNKWYICEEEARLVRYAFAKANAGCCYQDILAGLDQMSNEKEGARVWSFARMKHMLTHEAYIGDLLTNKSFKPDVNTQVKNRGERDQYYIEGHHEPIVSKEIFERVGSLVRRGLLRSQRVNFTDEEKTVLLDAIDQDVEKWRFEDRREVSNTAEADMIGGAV